MAVIPRWNTWPTLGQHNHAWGNQQRSEGLPLGWEWNRRRRAAEQQRLRGRYLKSWEEVGRGWDQAIMSFTVDNVPQRSIDVDNRWGPQIFALPADGYDTLEFYDEDLNVSEDHGLLSWITGTLLQTVMSTLNMLRYTSRSFSFHLIPSPRPPGSHLTSTSQVQTTNGLHPRGSTENYLWEGMGTMVLVNKANHADRTMILEIRPPSIVNSGVIKAFARGSSVREWWPIHGDSCLGDVGQANLLQAQVYDSCVQNEVRFFVVTNLTYWAFGEFSADYSRCTVSPVVERHDRKPSLLQCLTAWTIRSFDERSRPAALPERSERSDLNASHDHHLPQEVPPYSDRQRHDHRMQRSQRATLPADPVEPDYASSYPQSRYPIELHTLHPGVVGTYTTDFGPAYGLPAYNEMPSPPLYGSVPHGPYSQAMMPPFSSHVHMPTWRMGPGGFASSARQELDMGHR
ncbi:hypothetical protein IAU60_004702 [Kwoniella sp. DSM 27419]